MSEHNVVSVTDEELYVVTCACGQRFMGITLSDAGGLFDSHIYDETHPKVADATS